MLKKPYLSAVPLIAISFIIGMLIGSINEKQAQPEHAQNIADKLDSVSSRINTLSSTVTQLQSIFLSIDIASNLPGIPDDQVLSETSEDGITHINDLSAVTTEKTGHTLTTDQKILYDNLSQRIESAHYGTFTMDQLLAEMQDIPEKNKMELLGKVTALINSGQLDPKKFVEGSY